MGSSMCVSCTIKTEESELPIQQIVLEYVEQPMIIEVPTPQEHAPETDASKTVTSPQLKGILKHHDHFDFNSNGEESKNLTTNYIPKKRVKFRKSSQN